MSTYNWLSLFGVPAVILAILTWVYKKLSAKQKKTNDTNDAIRAGMCALLRDRLYQLYRYCKSQNGATQNERGNFNNMYLQYHALGGNGVMDDTRDKFFALPIRGDD